jgi:hypothetical protein
MHAKKDAARTARLAIALKDNLKRRKAQATAKAANAPATRALGKAPRAGLEGLVEPGPNPDKKGW